MSANGAFTSTLDYNFIGGGVVTVRGPVSVSIDPILDASAVVPISASFSNSIDFTFAGGIETPTIKAYVDVSFDFTASATAGQGIQTFGSSEWINRLNFTGSAEGYVVVQAYFTPTLEFNLDTNIYVFSEGPAAGLIDYSVAAKGTNVSTHIYDRVGASYCSIDSLDHNIVNINVQSNSIKISDNGSRAAEIIQN
jgi:hypothetical protein